MGRNQDARLEVFAVASDGGLWHIWQTTPSGGWSTWDRLGAPNGGTLGELAVGTNQDGRLEVFATSQNALWHVWQTAPNGSWGTWDGLGAPSGVNALASLAVGTNADGRLEVFAFAPKNAVWHMWQTAANNGWSAWTSLGGEPAGGPGRGPERRWPPGGLRGRRRHWRRARGLAPLAARRWWWLVGRRCGLDHRWPGRGSRGARAPARCPFARGRDQRRLAVARQRDLLDENQSHSPGPIHERGTFGRVYLGRLARRQADSPEPRRRRDVVRALHDVWTGSHQFGSGRPQRGGHGLGRHECP